jgi:undecaprenyl-diphosphatase
VSNRERLRAFNEKFVVEVRTVEPSTKRALYIWSVALAIVGVVAFGVILRDVITHDDIATIDKPFAALLNGVRTPELTAVMIWLAIIFGPIVLPIVALVVVVAWGFFAKHIWRPLLLAGGMLAGLILIQVITRIVGRERPPVDQMLFGVDMTPSFPSGHVMGASDLLLLIAYLVFSRRSTPVRGVLGFILAAILIVVAAVSRIYLGYHWLTDALASISLSLVVLGGVIAVDTHRTVRLATDPKADTQLGD